MAGENGDAAALIDRMARAVAAAPAAVEPRVALAEVLVKAGRVDEAAVALARAVELAADPTPQLLRLVDLLMAAGRPEAAFRALGRGLERLPRSAPLYARLGRLLCDEGRLGDADAAADRALSLEADCVEAILLKADLHERAGDTAAALALYEAALVRHPTHVGLGFGRARVLHRTGRTADAVAIMAALVAAAPRDRPLRYEFGLIRRDGGDVAGAEAIFRQMIAEDPADLPPRLALSRLLAEQGRTEAAVALQADTIRRFPTAWEERASYGTNLLRLGHFRQGFAEHEHRLKTGLIEEPAGIGWYPMWQGEPLDGRMLWLYPEQGFGDMIQFLRFAPEAARSSGGRVVIGIFPPLARLCGDLPGVARVVTDMVEPDAGAVRCPLMSLADRLAVTEATLPAAVPYLTVPAAVREQWRTCLDDLDGFKVGLIWRGNPDHKRDAARSIDPAGLAALALPGVRFVALDRDLDAPPHGLPFPIHLPGKIEDFADTGAIVEQLDLVIAVDTAVAHLAGALGRPVWTLLDFEGDWRWPATAERTPWYPTMRLFRQKIPGDWLEVLDRVAAALADTVAGAAILSK